jgi:rRNA maturation protein Nop10
MIRTCDNCHRITGYRNCPYCGSEMTTPVRNRPEDRIPVKPEKETR